MLAQPAVAERVVLKGLTIELGPKAEVWVMNHAVHSYVSGKVVVTGPADPQKLQLQGTIFLDHGEVCLLCEVLGLSIVLGLIAFPWCHASTCPSSPHICTHVCNHRRLHCLVHLTDIQSQLCPLTHLDFRLIKYM